MTLPGKRARWLLWLLGPLQAACAVGSPLVDDRDLLDGIGSIQCPAPPQCEPQPWTATSLPAAAALDFAGCGRSARCRPGSFADVQPSAAEGCAPESVQALPLIAECSVLALQHPSELTEQRYTGVHWTTVELTLASETPLRVVLAEAQLHGVAVHLTGPVVLELQDTQSNDLRVDGTASAQGEPRVELLRVAAEELRIGAADQAFDGPAALRATSVRGLSLVLSELQTESSRLEDGELQVDSLSAADTSFVRVELLARVRSLLSASSADECRLQLCGDPRLVGGKLKDSQLIGCQEARLRVYGSGVTGGSLDGQLEADQSSFEGVAFGTVADTEITAFQGAFGSDALCGLTHMFALDSGSLIKCSQCDDAFELSMPACLLMSTPDAVSPLQGNFCPILNFDQHLPSCEPGLAERTRQR